MIKVEKMSYSFPQKDLYNNVSFTIEPGQHCAFVGASGSGKSTLVDIIMNPEDIMFKGTLEVSLGNSIGLVSQFSQVERGDDISVFDYIAKEFIAFKMKSRPYVKKWKQLVSWKLCLSSTKKPLTAMNHWVAILMRTRSTAG